MRITRDGREERGRRDWRGGRIAGMKVGRSTEERGSRRKDKLDEEG